MKDRKNRKNGCRSINTISFLISMPKENHSGSIDKMKLCRDISQRVRKYRERKFFVELISKYNFAYLTISIVRKFDFQMWSKFFRRVYRVGRGRKGFPREILRETQLAR